MENNGSWPIAGRSDVINGDRVSFHKYFDCELTMLPSWYSFAIAACVVYEIVRPNSLSKKGDDVMNGDRISFNEGIEFEHFFIKSNLRPWFVLTFLTLTSQIKRLHLMTMGMM